MNQLKYKFQNGKKKSLREGKHLQKDKKKKFEPKIFMMQSYKKFKINLKITLTKSKN